MPASELAQRVAVAAVGIPAAVAVIYVGDWVLGAVLALAAAASAAELYRLAARRGVRAFGVAGAVGAGVFVLAASAGQGQAAIVAPWLWSLAVGLVLLAGGAAVWARGVDGQPLAAMAVTVFGAIFPGWTLAHAVLLRHAFGAVAAGAPAAWVGTALVVFAIGLTWINDSFAYFAGRAWGRRRLAPAVSPGKTVEGSIAGVVGAMLAGAIYAGLVLDGLLGVPIGAAAGAIGGVVIAGGAQVGDLVESVLKREAGVKDSGRLFPGHGGVLDRLDALFFTLPLAYWYVQAVLQLAAGGVRA